MQIRRRITALLSAPARKRSRNAAHTQGNAATPSQRTPQRTRKETQTHRSAHATNAATLSQHALSATRQKRRRNETHPQGNAATPSQPRSQRNPTETQANDQQPATHAEAETHQGATTAHIAEPRRPQKKNPKGVEHPLTTPEARHFGEVFGAKIDPRSKKRHSKSLQKSSRNVFIKFYSW